MLHTCRDHPRFRRVNTARCAVKYAWIERHRAIYPLALMCALLAVSLNGFRAWLRGGSPDRQRLSDAQVVALIRAIHAESSAPTVRRVCSMSLRARGFRVGKAHVEGSWASMTSVLATSGAS